MLWFYESFFPVVWIAFILYWRIKAADTKTSQRLEPNAWPVLRALIFLVVILLLSIPRLPLPWLYHQALADGPAALLDWSCCYRRRPSVRRLGAPAPRAQLEQRRNHQARPRVDYDRSLCPGSSPHLHRHSDRVSWHCDCPLAGARGHRFRLNFPRVVG